MSSVLAAAFSFGSLGCECCLAPRSVGEDCRAREGPTLLSSGVLPPSSSGEDVKHRSEQAESRFRETSGLASHLASSSLLLSSSSSAVMGIGSLSTSKMLRSSSSPARR